MKIHSLFLIFSVLGSFSQGNACSLPPGFKTPELAQTFERAKAVFRGKVTEVAAANEKNSTASHKIKLKVTTAFKGGISGETTVFAEMNMCDTLGSQAQLGEDCLIFVDGKDKAISGVYGGHASECASKGNLKTFEENVAKKLQKLGLSSSAKSAQSPPQ